VEILVKRKANFFLLKKSDRRKLLFWLRKIAFIEQDLKRKAGLAPEINLKHIFFLK